MTRFLLILGLLLMTSCTPLLSLPKQPVPSAQHCFSRAIDAFAANGQVAGLQRCAEDFTASEWSVRARTLIDLNARLSRCQNEGIALAEQTKQDQERIEGLQQELAEQSRRLQLLAQENAELEKTLEQLKGLLIELEQRPE